MNRVLLFLIVFCNCNFLLASKGNGEGKFCANPKPPTLNQRGSWAISWGYNRSIFTKSNIHFEGEGFDFTLYDVKASDRPTPYSTRMYFGFKTFTIPQYNYSVEYFIKDRIGITIGMDHIKYVMNNNQTLNIVGNIDHAASTIHSGVYQDIPTFVGSDFIGNFEHSDGLNYLHSQINFYQPLWISDSLNFELSIYGGAGLGVYIPKTKVNLFGKTVDNRFHMAGFGFSAQGGVKFSFFTHFFIKSEIKVGSAFLHNVLCTDANSQINHSFGWGQWITSLGGAFNFYNTRKKEGVRATF